MPVPSSWLTAARVRRLHDVLGSVPDRSPGLPDRDARMTVWRRCGGPIEEVQGLMDVLVHAELLRRERGNLQQTPAGRRTVQINRTQNERPIALALIRSGLMHDQVRLLLDTFPLEPDGSLRCRLREAQGVAPQLVGLLQCWTTGRQMMLSVSTQLVDELGAVWALIAPPSEARAFEEIRRKSIGDRAEAYSYQLERMSAAAASFIVWVAKDDDGLGYDLEDRTNTPRRRIEVKGSGGSEPRFFMSDNEWKTAHEDPDTYEVHFWGGIDLNRTVADEYRALRAMGFPVVLQNLPALRAAGSIEAQPERWRVAAT